MLSETGDAQAVAPMAALLADKGLRKVAQGALTRLPETEARTALADAVKTAPEEFKSSLAESLRARGQTVAGYPSPAGAPAKATSVGKSSDAAKPDS